MFKVLIPRGYVGWIRVDLCSPGAPPLPLVRGKYLARVPTSGWLRTSTCPGADAGWSLSTDLYPSGHPAASGIQRVTTPHVWASTIFSGGTYIELFAGTEKQYHAFGTIFGDGKRLGTLDPEWAQTWAGQPRELRGRDLRRKRLVAANLTLADLRGSDLTGADLVRACLIRASLQGARLRRAKLAHADLFESRLDGALLEGADLRGARLEGAELRNARLGGAKLSGAVYDPATEWPRGFNPRSHGALRVPAEPGHTRRLYLIPDGYVGTIRVDYGVPGTPPLPSAGGGRYRILRFPASGHLETSSDDDEPTDYGVGEVQRGALFCYYVGEGRRPLDAPRMVHAGAGGTQPRGAFQEFFIGTAEQYNRRHAANH